MVEISTPPEVQALLDDRAPVVAGLSGGKDSQAVAWAVARHLRVPRRRWKGWRTNGAITTGNEIKNIDMTETETETIALLRAAVGALRGDVETGDFERNDITGRLGDLADYLEGEAASGWSSEEVAPGSAANLETIRRAAANGDLAVMACRWVHDGSRVDVLCAASREGESVRMVPLATLFMDDPYKTLQPPATDE